MWWIISFVAIIIFVPLIASYTSVKKMNKEQRRREELRKKRITSQPSRPRRDSRKETISNKSTFTPNKILSEKLDNKTRSDYQAFPGGLVSPLETIRGAVIREEYFKDNWCEGTIDYSHMSPDEAKWELKYRKKDDGYIPWEEYGGLLDAIAAEKDDKYLSIIQSKTPKEVEKWFRENIRSDIRMSQFIWKKVGEILKPIHESFLLEGMEHCSVRSIESYVKNRKQEGYFFTQKVYDLANRIYSGEYDPVAIRAKENASVRAKKNAPEKALKEKIRRTKNNIRTMTI